MFKLFIQEWNYLIEIYGVKKWVEMKVYEKTTALFVNMKTHLIYGSENTGILDITNIHIID